MVVAGQIQLIALVIPSLIMKAKKLHIDTKSKLKDIAIKFTRATCYIAWCATIPWPLVCILSKLGVLSPGSFWPYKFAYTIGMCGALIEPVEKMGQYVGFYVPKIVEAMYGAFVKRGYISDFKSKRFFLLILMCGLIGIAHSRSHYVKELSKYNEQK